MDPAVASHHPFPDYGAAQGLDVTDSIDPPTAIIPSSFSCCLVHWQPEKPSWKRGINLDFEGSRIFISGEQLRAKAKKQEYARFVQGQ